MREREYYQPETCIPGRIYFMRKRGSNNPGEYIDVRFIGYRPHPAELLVLVGDKRKVIHRIFILEKNGKEGGS